MMKRNEEMQKELKAVVLERLNDFEEVTDERVLEIIDEVLKNSYLCRNISLGRRCHLRQYSKTRCFGRTFAR